LQGLEHASPGVREAAIHTLLQVKTAHTAAGTTLSLPLPLLLLLLLLPLLILLQAHAAVGPSLRLDLERRFDCGRDARACRLACA
jgi:hypothetical protein